MRELQDVKDRRLIEETFPVKEVSIESVREKNIRHGHISTLHIWWARRPLASSRATNYAALVPAPKDIEEWNKRREFIINLCKWENSTNQTLIQKAREDVLKAYGGRPPRVLDPFAGGGAIPLEAMRLGCETYSSDYNPVSVLIQKCTLEYPQKYGRVHAQGTKWGGLSGFSEKNPLLEDVKKWGKWVLEEAKKEIGRFYPEEKDGSIPVGYIWARTIPCQNPACHGEIPLMRQFWLAKKEKKKVALCPYVDGGSVQFKIAGNGYERMPEGFDPGKGTISKAVASCLVCGSMVDAKTMRKLFREGEAGQRMVAVVLHKPGITGKKYRTATEQDLEIFREAERCFEKKREELKTSWGTDPVPYEVIHTPDGREYKPGNLLYNFTPVLLYGMTKWGDLFNPRQKLALITFVEKVKQAHKRMLAEGVEEEYAKALAGYLALAIDRTLMFTSTMTRWKPDAESPVDIFSRQALPMTWDYSENNLVHPHSGAFISQIGRILHSSKSAFVSDGHVSVSQSSATSLPYSDEFFDAVLTDPPYYDNVPYADLSDFFYVWLKRTIGELHPELFSTPTTPKSGEIIAELPLLRGMGKEKAAEIVTGIKTSEHFELMLRKSFQEMYRVLRLDGIAVIVYAHKSTAGWETLINSLLDSGLIVTGAWPINTEMQARLRAKESAALASSIYIVARKMKREPTGFYNEVKEKLRQHLNQKLERLWQEGVSGADFFIAAIGSAIEVFGRYEKVMDFEGNVIRADRLLDDVREIATDYAVRQILRDGFAGGITNMTRLYVLWRWQFGEAKVPFDDGRKLAQSCGIDLSHEWGERGGLIRKEKEFIRVIGPQSRRRMEDLENSRELIDVLHHVLLLWEKGRREEMVRVLNQTGFGKSEVFFRVAQAVSETLPAESKEKKLLDGFLVGKDRIRDEVTKELGQRRLA